MKFTLTALAFLVALPGCSGFPRTATEPLPPSPSLAISLDDPAYRQIASLSKLAPFWSGRVHHARLPSLMSYGQCIVNEPSWQVFWKALSGSKPVPAIDFGKHFVYVDSQNANDPNQISTVFFVDTNGTMIVQSGQTQIGFELSESVKVRLYRISREGIQWLASFDSDARKYRIIPFR